MPPTVQTESEGSAHTPAFSWSVVGDVTIVNRRRPFHVKGAQKSAQRFSAGRGGRAFGSVFVSRATVFLLFGRSCIRFRISLWVFLPSKTLTFLAVNSSCWTTVVVWLTCSLLRSNLCVTLTWRFCFWSREKQSDCFSILPPAGFVWCCHLGAVRRPESGGCASVSSANWKWLDDPMKSNQMALVVRRSLMTESDLWRNWIVSKPADCVAEFN